jgi:hypothetical protein
VAAPATAAWQRTRHAQGVIYHFYLSLVATYHSRALIIAERLSFINETAAQPQDYGLMIFDLVARHAAVLLIICLSFFYIAECLSSSTDDI